MDQQVVSGYASRSTQACKYGRPRLSGRAKKLVPGALLRTRIGPFRQLVQGNLTRVQYKMNQAPVGLTASTRQLHRPCPCRPRGLRIQLRNADLVWSELHLG